MKRLVFILLAFISLGCYSQNIEVGDNYIKYDNIAYNRRDLHHLEFVDSIIKSNAKIKYVNFYKCGSFVKSIKAKKFTTDEQKLFSLINRQTFWQQLKPTQSDIARNEYFERNSVHGSYTIIDSKCKILGTFTSY